MRPATLLRVLGSIACLALLCVLVTAAVRVAVERHYAGAVLSEDRVTLVRDAVEGYGLRYAESLARDDDTLPATASTSLVSTRVDRRADVVARVQE